MRRRQDTWATSWRASCAVGAPGWPRRSPSDRAGSANASTSWIWAEPVNVDALLVGVTPGVIYVVVALVIGLESMGIPLPGEVILVSAALLATRHELDVSPIWVAVSASSGAIVGDNIGYLAVRRWCDRMLDLLGLRFPRHAGPDRLAYAEHIFARYGVLAVFLGRFVALLRIFAGPLAGALRMPYPRFLGANALGGVIWACGTTTAIYAVGTRAEVWLKDSAWIGLALAVAVGVAVSTIFRRRLQRAVARYAAEREQRLDEPKSSRLTGDAARPPRR